jgi:8-oxo-dGTP pyrophosphatase MutT (NUDIX family)
MENLKREVKEETGLEIEGEPKLLAAQDIIKNEKHVVRLTYEGEANGTVTLSDEHDGYKWLSIDEIKKIPNLDNYLQVVLGVKI